MNHSENVMALTYEDMNCEAAGNYDSTAYALVLGVCEYIGLDLSQIQNEAITRQSLTTGETLVLSGTLVSLVERDQRGWISLFSESTNSGNRWEIMARDPPGVVFDIPGNSITNYAITAKALEPGVYHVHTQLNVANVGPGLGPGTTVVVEGEAIIKPIPWGMLAYQSIMILAAYVVTFATRPWQVI